MNNTEHPKNFGLTKIYVDGECVTEWFSSEWDQRVALSQVIDGAGGTVDAVQLVSR